MQGSRALIVVAAIVAAGCLGAAPEPSAAGDGATDPAFETGGAIVHGAGGAVPSGLGSVDGTTLDIGQEAAEPTLGLTSDGTLFYAAVDWDNRYVQPRTEIMRSTDQGQSWEQVTPKVEEETSTPPVTLDPYVYVDPATDRVFSPDLTVACNWLRFSDDGGDSWLHNPAACGTPVNDHQTLAAGPTSDTPTVGYENAVYYCVNQVVDSFCSRSLDGGLTWSPGTVVFPGYDPEAGGFCGGLHGHVNVGPQGTVYLGKGHCGDPWVGVSHDDGVTWDRVQLPGDTGVLVHDVMVAVDDVGNAYALWLGDDAQPYLSVSTDQGESWSEPVDVGPPELTAANLPDIAAGREGRIALIYAGTTVEDGYDGDMEAATWNGYLTVSTDALAEEPTLVTTTINDRDDPIYRGQCGPGRCVPLYDFLDVKIGPDGRPWAAFVDACTDDCVTDGAENDAARGIVGTTVGGPSLRGNGTLPALGS